ncbi:hypothetical protein Vafri_4743 [Volvox africanus]|uniref:Uncharacterized protein n=1 Tax=Volvox africanus TaxID=51714 RepID=A0A8J4EU45_9CHLO|nr:hypothetical protein Vafri_4743 [Volvox africanus]
MWVGSEDPKPRRGPWVHGGHGLTLPFISLRSGWRFHSSSTCSRPRICVSHAPCTKTLESPRDALAPTDPPFMRPLHGACARPHSTITTGSQKQREKTNDVTAATIQYNRIQSLNKHARQRETHAWVVSRHLSFSYPMKTSSAAGDS